MGNFEHYCTCGGFAWSMNGRPQSQPHMTWCPQYAEYAEWWESIKENLENQNDEFRRPPAEHTA